MEILRFEDGGRPYFNQDFQRLQDLPFDILDTMAQGRDCLITGFEYNAGTIQAGTCWFNGKLRQYAGGVSGFTPGELVYVYETTSQYTQYQTYESGGSKPVREKLMVSVSNLIPNGDYFTFRAGEEMEAKGLITSHMLSSRSIKTRHLESAQIEGGHIKGKQIIAGHIGDEAVISRTIQADAVTTDKVKDGNITRAKLKNRGLALDTWINLTPDSAVTGEFKYLVDSSGFVVLRGAFSGTTGAGGSIYLCTIFDPDHKPASVLRFPIHVQYQNTYYPGIIEISNGGSVYLRLGTAHANRTFAAVQIPYIRYQPTNTQL